MASSSPRLRRCGCRGVLHRAVARAQVVVEDEIDVAAERAVGPEHPRNRLASRSKSAPSVGRTSQPRRSGSSAARLGLAERTLPPLDRLTPIGCSSLDWWLRRVVRQTAGGARGASHHPFLERRVDDGHGVAASLVGHEDPRWSGAGGRPWNSIATSSSSPRTAPPPAEHESVTRSCGGARRRCHSQPAQAPGRAGCGTGMQGHPQGPARQPTGPAVGTWPTRRRGGPAGARSRLFTPGQLLRPAGRGRQKVVRLLASGRGQAPALFTS